MEEAVAGTSTVKPLGGIESINDDDGIDVDNLIDSIDPIGAPFDPSTPITVVDVPTSIITCNPNRSPRDKSIRDMKNKEDAFEEGYDSDGEMGQFYNRTDKEGQQIFNRIPVVRILEVRATVFFTSKIHALNTYKMVPLLRSDVKLS
jgi:hypothetical protein